MPTVYKGLSLGEACRADIVVAATAILAVEAASSTLPAHEARLPADLAMSGLRAGPLPNLSAVDMRDGICRFVV